MKKSTNKMSSNTLANTLVQVCYVHVQCMTMGQASVKLNQEIGYSMEQL